MDGHRHKHEIDAFLFVIVTICLLSGVLLMLPENFGTPRGRTQIHLFMGFLVLLCIPALFWVRKLIHSR